VSFIVYVPRDLTLRMRRFLTHTFQKVRGSIG